jgi:hypothetical protein
VTQTLRRLPGIRFEQQAPPLPEVLPRMDVAGFVGFATSGPIDVPVPVEDATQFARVFGADAPLAWDEAHREPTFAFLGPAVRAFFRNGGRRCWVVRVADTTQAKADAFPLPGIVAVGAAGAAGEIAQAVLRARSEGSWADRLGVSASLEPTPVRLQAYSLASLSFEALVASRSDLVPGDLLRISFPSSEWTLMFAVGSLGTAHGSPPASSPPGDGEPQLQRLSVQGRLGYWVRVAELVPGLTGNLQYVDAQGSVRTSVATVPTDSSGGDGVVRISLGADSMSPPQPGALVRGEFGTGAAEETVWIDVADVDVARDGTLAVVGTPFEITEGAPAPLPVQADEAFAERLTLRLRVEDEAGGESILGGLGFVPAHPRFVGSLPTDALVYADPQSPPAPGTLAADAAQPRFPLAGPDRQPLAFLPLGATVLEGPALPAIQPAGSARRRDGLERLNAAVFLDHSLATVDAGRLIEEAFWIQYQQRNTRPLRGIHALLAVDEVTLVAAPDAVQRDWYLAAGATIVSPEAPEAAAEPDWSTFLDCATHVPATPVLSQVGDAETGRFALVWSPTDTERATYELQETTTPPVVAAAGSPPGEAAPGDAAAETLYSGPELEFAVYGRPPDSTLYYRVRALAGTLASGWSNWVTVSTAETQRWLLDEPSGYNAADTLLPIQLALLRMCAARGDLFAVLALPEHYRERAAIAHVHLLKASERPPGSEPDPIFSYGALYHPWLYTSDLANPAAIRRTPPDGAAAGVIAGRAARRGAWVAPANEPLRNVVQLDPPLNPDSHQALQDAQVNVIRHDPGGFLWLAADTLSDDSDLRPIGVRRLLQVLRRAALLHGAVYAFEPGSDALRRTVQRGFERLLARMFELGAFAGATAADAYRVETGSPPNTRESIDAGRLIVDLKVAPSRPLVFLTVRLVRTGEGTLQVEIR